jgi:L-lactate dehydrogenase (cytochrome)/(S)-mandelate dehydrogenase
MSLNKVLSLDDFRARARRRLPRIAFDFIDGGVDDEISLSRNRAAFRRYRLVPRYLRKVAERDQSMELFGRRYSSPFGISPTGLADLFRPGADKILAEAAREANVPFLLSSAANGAIEDIAPIAPDNVWFQVYATSDAAINRDLVRRARTSGVGVLVVTVDVPVNANRERNRRNGFTRPFRMTPSIVFDALTHPAWVARYLRVGGMPMMGNWRPYARQGASAAEVADLYSTLTPADHTDWSTLEEIRQAWTGPLLIKGLLHPGDVVRARRSGVDGVIVSNHGGRQLDAMPSPVDMLPSIRAAAGDDFPLILDSGVRRGTDVVIAKCLGASACIAGRPTLYAVSADGRAGADHALSLMRREIDVVLAQLGCPVFEELDRTILRPMPHGEEPDLLTGCRDLETAATVPAGGHITREETPHE